MPPRPRTPSIAYPGTDAGVRSEIAPAGPAVKSPGFSCAKVAASANGEGLGLPDLSASGPASGTGVWSVVRNESPSLGFGIGHRPSRNREPWHAAVTQLLGSSN